MAEQSFFEEDKNLPATQKSNLPAEADLFDQGPTGLENIGAQDLVIPRLTILQALSPQLNPNKPEYIAEAKLGDFCDTGLGEIFRGEIVLLPCFYNRVFLEWFPRASGKGIAANHGTDASILTKCRQDEKRRWITAEGNLVAETATYFCLNISAGGRMSFLPMASTQLKNARKWMTLITAQRLRRRDGTEFMPPIFYRSWKAIPVAQTNNEGSWFGWKFSPDKSVLELDPTQELLEKAKEFHKIASSGIARGDLAAMAEEHAREESRGPSNGPGPSDDDIPF